MPYLKIFMLNQIYGLHVIDYLLKIIDNNSANYICMKKEFK